MLKCAHAYQPISRFTYGSLFIASSFSGFERTHLRVSAQMNAQLRVFSVAVSPLVVPHFQKPRQESSAITHAASHSVVTASPQSLILFEGNIPSSASSNETPTAFASLRGANFLKQLERSLNRTVTVLGAG